MTKLLLSLHVLAAIVAVGPVTVAASMFPPAARRAAPADGTDPGPHAAGTVELLHRICRVYAGLGVLVPVLGLATGLAMGPGRRLARHLGLSDRRGRGPAHRPRAPPSGRTRRAGDRGPAGRPRSTVQLAMFTGVFNLLWATVTVLMIVRPGSTTGA